MWNWLWPAAKEADGLIYRKGLLFYKTVLKSDEWEKKWPTFSVIATFKNTSDNILAICCIIAHELCILEQCVVHEKWSNFSIIATFNNAQDNILAVLWVFIVLYTNCVFLLCCYTVQGTYFGVVYRQADKVVIWKKIGSGGVFSYPAFNAKARRLNPPPPAAGGLPAGHLMDPCADSHNKVVAVAVCGFFWWRGVS